MKTERLVSFSLNLYLASPRRIRSAIFFLFFIIFVPIISISSSPDSSNVSSAQKSRESTVKNRFRKYFVFYAKREKQNSGEKSSGRGSDSAPSLENDSVCCNCFYVRSQTCRGESKKVIGHAKRATSSTTKVYFKVFLLLVAFFLIPGSSQRSVKIISLRSSVFLYFN